MFSVRFLVSLLIVFLASAFAMAEDTLPRVLILGDSVYRQPAADLSKAFKGKAQIIHPAMKPGIVFNTTTALDSLDSLLGEGKWDVIHFNCGLGDLVYRAPDMKSFRLMPRHVGGVRTTTAEQYEKNLNELVKRLKATGAKLIWASTTPIRHSTTNVFELGSEVSYNAVAAKVMKQNKVPINDMYTYVKSLIDMKKPASHGADPFHFDRKPIHSPMVNALADALNMPSLSASEKD